MARRDNAEHMRGRDGRPYRRLRQWLKDNGTNVCRLCGQPIDMTLPYRHPWSWTLEHIVPISKGGDPLDPANAGEAHYGCNSARQDREPGAVQPPKGSHPW